MKLEDQVCSVRQAEILKKIGVNQDNSYAGWRQTSVAMKLFVRNEDDDYDYAAFTATELGEMLPATHMYSDLTYRCITLKEDQWVVSYISANHQIFNSLFGRTEAEARAEMLIYLITRKIITIESVNKLIQ